MPQKPAFQILAAVLAYSVSVDAGSGPSTPAPKLPVPCAAGACGAGGPSKFVTAGAAGAVAAANSLTINQTTNSAILNWSSFDIGAGGTVTFKQPGQSSIALNRIFQASPSQIFGSLNANGQVYLLNLNGFLFGPTATVNVGGLLASSLPLSLTDANFSKGILSPLQNSQAVFDATLDPLAPGVGRTYVLDGNGSPVLDANGKPQPVQISVQPGAQLTAADQGRLLLAGQNVTNGGTLTAPDGQVVLAAGAKVYLQADTDPGLRGLIVEVDQGGKAWNQLTGTLSTPRGNVTMVGLAVNQEGRISATTSVSANGSVRLEAADTHAFSAPGGNVTVASAHGGALTIGSQSDIEILPELASGATAVAAQTQLPPTVTLLGEQVILKGGSIVAPHGDLTAIAASDPSVAASPTATSPIAGVASPADPNARLRIDAGTTIDLSGTTASLPASANLLAVQLRSSELADDPTQRNGALHGQTVYVDSRLGNPLIANLQGDFAAVPQSIAQLSEAGGHAVFQSQGDAVFASGASVNVSGGASTYAGGVLQTSYLVGANGKLYPIATADPSLQYVGVVNPTFTQIYNSWGVKDVLATPGLSTYQPGYVQGAKAGSVEFVAPALVLAGTLRGSAVNGLYQRTPATAVGGGQLIIGLPNAADSSAQSGLPIDYIVPAVRLSTTTTPIVVADDASLPGPLTLDLPVSYLTNSGFTSTQVLANNGFTLPAATPLMLAPGSSLSVDAGRVDLLSSIRDPAGKLNFQSLLTVGTVGNPQRPGVFLGDGVTFDVRGLWTNDMVTLLRGGSALDQTWQNGGSISLGVSAPGGLLSLGNDDALRASGGAWIQNNGALAAGTGGSISLNANAVTNGVTGIDVGSNLALDAFGVNGAAGGTLSLTVPRVEIGAGVGNWAAAQQVDDMTTPGGVFHIAADLFAHYGFQTFQITASGLVDSKAPTTNVITVDAGTAVDTTLSTLYLNRTALLQPSAPTLDGLASVTTLPSYLRTGGSVALSALPAGSGSDGHGGTTAGDIEIGAGASITTDAGGSVSLTGFDSIVVDGTLRAPGGAVSLHVLSPDPISDLGFLSTQRIELGSMGTIDVSGAFVAKPSTLGLSVGTVYGGGTVNLLADRGAVVADSGSMISVAGISTPLDLAQSNGRYAHEIAATAGGAIVVHSGESIALEGAINAAAGGAGTSGAAAAGSLDLALTRSEPWWGVNGTVIQTFNQGPMTVEIVPSITQVPPSSFSDNSAFLGTTQLSQWGFDALRLEAGDVLQFSGSQFAGALSLGLGRQLVIEAPAIALVNAANVNLTAPYIQAGYNSALPYQNNQVAMGGSGSVNFHGNEIDLLGPTVFQGTSNVSFSSSGDLKLLGEASSGVAGLTGSLTVAGNVTLDAARIYPLTDTSFDITAVQPAPGVASSVTIGQTGANPGTPLSAGGALTLTADNLTSTGTLYAPFGTIKLTANNNLTLGDGSLTSVSGGGLVIPYGQTQFGGQQWLYQAGGGSQTITGVPSRLVGLKAPNITVTQGAAVDLAGGGDLSAYEWVPGSGGTKDALTGAPNPTNPNSGYVPGLYAILPSTRAQASPQDPQNTALSPILPGETVYLSGGAGLAAGFYPLLPARYALEPGAFLIQVEPQIQTTSPGPLANLASGTPVVAGYLSYGSTGLHQTPGYTGFAVYPGSYGEQLAQYNQVSASSYFSAAATLAGTPRPTLPADAGTFSIAVTTPLINSITNTLNLAGQVRSAAAAGGLPAPIEISANDLVVGRPSGSVAADAVSVSASVIDSWQPGSLLLGGTVTASSTTVANGSTLSSSTIDVVSNSVTVGAGTTLSADQITLVANQSIDVQSGATLQSTSAASGKTPAPLMQSVTFAGASVTAGATPALLSVSDLNWLIPVRSGGPAPVGAATVTVDPGSTLASRGALSIDGIGGVTLGGTLTGSGAEWSLGSSSIALVPAGVQADALAIGPGLLTQLGAAGAVRLASTGSIDLYAPVTLGVDSSGSPTLAALTLSASSLNNLTGAPSPGTAGPTAGPTLAEFGAKTLVLEGSGVGASSATAGPAGANLALYAGELDLGPNALSVNGFAKTQATVSGAVIGHGTGGLAIGGDATFAAAGITAAGAANTDIAATGALKIAPAATGGSGKLPALLGGELNLSGGSIDIAGNVAAQSGIVTLQSASTLTFDPGATVSAAGSLVTIQNHPPVGTPGGSIAATAGTALTLSPGAILDVSGAGSAGGGSLILAAGGSATVGATLKGSGGPGSGGNFSMDAGYFSAGNGAAANPLTTLAAALGAGGFTDSIDMRVRSGNLSLDAGSSLTANAVTLAADSGQLAIGGTITADSGALRGALSLFGGAGVTVSGALHADGGTSGRGGTIEIGAGQLTQGAGGLLNQYGGGSIELAGSQISTTGSQGNGSVLLRAPALTATNDVAIGSLASTTFTGVGQVLVEPVLPYNTGDATFFSNATAPTAADFANVLQNVQTYMTTAGTTIGGRLAVNGSPVTVQPAVDIVASDPHGVLTLQSADGASPALDLSTWRFNNGATPVDLTIRAAGDLMIANTVTDGFGSTTVRNVSQPVLLNGPSSSIHLVAGADLAGANPLQAVTGGSGTLTLGLASGSTPAVVRTGTGSIDLIAANDIVIGNQGSGAYTAGVPAIQAGATALDPYPGIPSNSGTYLTATDALGNPTYVQGIQLPASSLVMSLPMGGGGVTVRAGHDVLGAALTTPTVAAWQLREGGSHSTVNEWGVNLAAYDWNFGTLGGGDVRISAGHDALNVTAAAADSLLPQYGGVTQYVRGGGLSLTAGNDIGSAEVFLADGSGSVAAGGALTAILPSLASTGGQVGSGFFLQGSALDVTARLGIAADGVFNPTAFQSVPKLPPQVAGAFLSYTDSSSLSLGSVAGDISFGADGGSALTLLGLAAHGANFGDGIFPGSLTADAFGGGITFGPGIGSIGSITFAASPVGELNLLAAKDITGGNLTIQGGADGNIHSADATPALVTAGGSISALGLTIPKAAQVVAGQDITDLNYLGQNFNPNDVTLLMAGRDFVYTGNTDSSVSIGGPGALDLLAGRNVSLGFSRGVVTTGNLLNANLPTAQGADLTVATGLGNSPDFNGFLSKIIAPSGTYQTALVAYVESLQSSSGLTFAAARSIFEGLPAVRQQPLIDQIFFDELSNSGIAANAVRGAGFTEGYAAIDALFPGSRTGTSGAIPGSYAGDLTLAFSRIYTLSGGNINLLVPGGLINVGLANPPSFLADRPPSTLGIVAEGPGNVDIYSRGDVNVNASRIFTLGGGNILIWSDEGSIDAGRGAKTAVSAPPPSVLINSNGTVSINFSGAAAGSGIRTIQTDPTQPLGNVDLIAPVGTVNAGDAGIGSAGNINIAAAAVIGVSNINFGGTATGVPAQIGGISAGLSAASSAASGASNAATSAVSNNAAEKEGAAPLAQAALSWLDVFVTGLGEENCKPDDIECLKRQKTLAH